jgi:hypothetical protein
MKIELYIDVYPGQKVEYIMATTNPGVKGEHCKRFQITANIPDYAFVGEIDGAATVDSVTEVDRG